MRSLIGFSKPRAFSAGAGLAFLWHLALFFLAATPRRLRAYSLFLYRHFLELFRGPEVRLTGITNVSFSLRFRRKLHSRRARNVTSADGGREVAFKLLVEKTGVS